MEYLVVLKQHCLTLQRWTHYQICSLGLLTSKSFFKASSAIQTAGFLGDLNISDMDTHNVCNTLGTHTHKSLFLLLSYNSRYSWYACRRNIYLEHYKSQTLGFIPTHSMIIWLFFFFTDWVEDNEGLPTNSKTEILSTLWIYKENQEYYGDRVLSQRIYGIVGARTWTWC